MLEEISALLVEDDLIDARLFYEIIQTIPESTPTFHHTTQLSETLSVLKNRTFDVIVLALSSSDSQGLNIIRAVRELVPQVPIIILSRNKDHHLASQAIREGVQDYLFKSDIFSCHHLSHLGCDDIGHSIVKRLQYAIERAKLTKQLAISKERYELAVQGANDGVWDWNLQTNKVYYSPRWKELLGLSNDDIGDRPDDWISRIHPSDQRHFKKQLQRHLTFAQSQLSCEYRIRHRDNSYRWVLTRGMAIWDEDGIAYRIAGSQTDITARKALETELHQEKELAHITLHSIGDAVITTDAQGIIQDFNPVAEKLTGWRAKAAKGRSITEVCQFIDGKLGRCPQNPVAEAIKRNRAVHMEGQPTLVSQTGEAFAIVDSIAPIRSVNGDIVGTVLVFHDVTEERKRAEQLAWQASHDPLTQLCNRQKFVEVIDGAIATARSEHLQHILCYLDLDHFKAVNDTCGHAAGDELLQQVTEIWSCHLHSSDVLARLGGDEFGLLLYDYDMTEAIALANALCDAIQSYRFVYNDKLFTIGVSIGVVSITSETQHTKQVLKLADATCYAAKNKGRNRVHVYSPDDDDINQQSRTSQWYSLITRALDEQRFQLYHQMILSTEKVFHKAQLCEVLLRLSIPGSKQPTLPMAFIPSAERYNFMSRIDRWVVTKILDFLSHDAADPNMIYSINLSGMSINDETFIEFLKKELDHYSIAPKMLCFEITETVAIANLQKAAQFILELKTLGCSFALDDFGSGMSSFSYLKYLPVDYLKIDGSLVKDSLTGDIPQAILQSINHIGHLMGLKTIAEYVENQTILEKVQKMGIDYVQGFAIDCPKPLLTA
ncbi:MAG: EAL domain-containing protein [Cyanobacteria bacterium J06633_2]